MPRADRVYTNGLMARLERTVPVSEDGRVWHLEQGSVTYGLWWRVFERDTTTGALYREIVAGRTEYDMQRALGAFLDGYDRAKGA
jgi:hypothetical protein